MKTLFHAIMLSCCVTNAGWFDELTSTSKEFGSSFFETLDTISCPEKDSYGQLNEQCVNFHAARSALDDFRANDSSLDTLRKHLLKLSNNVPDGTQGQQICRQVQWLLAQPNFPIDVYNAALSAHSMRKWYL